MHHIVIGDDVASIVISSVGVLKYYTVTVVAANAPDALNKVAVDQRRAVGALTGAFLGRADHVVANKSVLTAGNGNARITSNTA
jgi:hypothetical protein